MLTDRHALSRAAAFLAGAGDWHLPLFRAAADGQIALAVMRNPETTWPRAIERVTLPAVVTVNADMGGDIDPLPAAWGCVRPLRRWANFFIVHAASGDPEHCRFAIDMAKRYGRVVIVECTTRTAGAWDDAIGRPCERVALIWPAPAAAPEKGTVH